MAEEQVVLPLDPSQTDWSKVDDVQMLREEITRLQEQNNALKASLPPVRRSLPATRQAITHKFDIAGHEGYFTVGLYDDGSPAELFITMAREGSTINGLMDTIGGLVTLALKYGVPLDVLVERFAHERFEPSGFTKNPDIPVAKSITDYIFRWLGMRFNPASDAPICDECGAITVREGAVFKCLNCGHVKNDS